MRWGWTCALLSLSGIGREVGWGGLLFEAGRLLTFSAFRMADVNMPGWPKLDREGPDHAPGI